MSNDNLFNFPQEKCFQKELIFNLQSIGYNDEEINQALTFVKNNPLEEKKEESNVIPLFKKEEHLAQVIPFRKR